MTGSITALTARELSAQIHARELSCRDVMDAYLARIDALNPTYNAIVSLQPREDLLAQAVARDVQLAHGEDLGWMHGFPMAIKDLNDAAGIVTTQGSPLFAHHVPTRDSTLVARMKGAGGIVIGKTNTPELGLGSHTYNRVFGVTRNAFDPTRSAGGSSGGAAVSLALGLQPVADGSDMMGSLRNPAAFNNVYALRPSPGRVPGGPIGEGFVEEMSTDGPMGRTVGDLAMLLSVQAGRDPSTPLSIAQGGGQFAGPLVPPKPGTRIGWLRDLDGYLPMEPGILEACEAGLRRLESVGCIIEPVALGFEPERIWRAWLTWRGWLKAGSLGPLYHDAVQRAQLKPEAIWEVEQGLGVTGADLYAAAAERAAFYRHLLALFDRFDALALPSAQVWPFDAELDWPRSVAGVAMDTYHRWMEVVVIASLGGLPAMSVPVAMSHAGLPMGMQLIGPPLGDSELLRLARAYEEAGPAR